MNEIPSWAAVSVYLHGGQKVSPCRSIVLKPADEATFSLKLNVEQTTEVNANKYLLVLNILSIKYSIYDVKCDANYSWTWTSVLIALVDDRRIRVSATENHRILIL